MFRGNIEKIWTNFIIGGRHFSGIYGLQFDSGCATNSGSPCSDRAYNGGVVPRADCSGMDVTRFTRGDGTGVMQRAPIRKPATATRPSLKLDLAKDGENPFLTDTAVVLIMIRRINRW